MMKKAKTIIGLEWNESVVRWVRGERSREGTTVAGRGEEIVREEGVSAALRALAVREGFAEAEVVASVPRHQVFLRKVTLPPGTEKEVRAMLRFEAEKYTPFPLENAVVDLVALSSGENAPNEAMMLIAKNEVVEKRLKVLADAGIAPSVLTVTSLAKQSVVCRVRTFKEATCGMVEIDEANWSFDFFRAGRLMMSRGFICRPGEDASELARRMVAEIRNSELSYASSFPDEKVWALYYAGYPDKTVADTLKREGIHPLDLSSGIEGMDFPGEAAGARSAGYLRPLGLVLSSGGPLNLIPPEIVRAARSKKAAKMRMRAAAAAIFLAAGCGAAYLGMHRASIGEDRALVERINAHRPELAALEREARRLDTLDRFSAGSLLPLEILRELGQVLPQGAYISLMNYDDAQKTLTLKGRADSFGTASLAAEKISRSPLFSRVENRGGRSINFEGRKLVDFEIHCTVVPQAAGTEKAGK